MALVAERFTKRPTGQPPSDSPCLLSLASPAGTKRPKDDDHDDPPLLDLSAPPSFPLYYVPPSLPLHAPPTMTVYGPTPSGPYVRLDCKQLTLTHKIFTVGTTSKDPDDIDISTYLWIEVTLTFLGGDQIVRTKKEIKDKNIGLVSRPGFEKDSWIASQGHAVFIWKAATPSLPLYEAHVPRQWE